MSRPTTCAGCRRGRLFTTGRPSDGTDERMPAGEAGTGRRGWKGPLGPLDDDECQALAEEIERQRPGWSVLWGVYSKRFTAFPPLSVPEARSWLSSTRMPWWPGWMRPSVQRGAMLMVQRLAEIATVPGEGAGRCSSPAADQI